MNDKEFFDAEIQKLLSYAEKSRREGILALEEQLEEMGSGELGRWDPIFVGIRLVVDGTDAEYVDRVLRNLGSHYQDVKPGSEAIVRSRTYHEIARVGCLSIQMGSNPRVLELELWSLLPQELRTLEPSL
jgi:flagellar motor component MotA